MRPKPVAPIFFPTNSGILKLLMYFQGVEMVEAGKVGECCVKMSGTEKRAYVVVVVVAASS
jgi:hypothetical protein